MADELKITPADPVDSNASPFDEPAGAPKTAGKAIAALVLGIIGLLLLGPLTGIPAIILGMMARKQIASDARLSGSGIALAGIVTGTLAIVFTGIYIALTGGGAFS